MPSRILKRSSERVRHFGERLVEIGSGGTYNLRKGNKLHRETIYLFQDGEGQPVCSKNKLAVYEFFYLDKKLIRSQLLRIFKNSAEFGAGGTGESIFLFKKKNVGYKIFKNMQHTCVRMNRNYRIKVLVKDVEIKPSKPSCAHLRGNQYDYKKCLEPTYATLVRLTVK